MSDENENKIDREESSTDSDEGLDDSVVAEESVNESIRRLKLKLKEAEKKSADYLTGWQRAQADFINYRKREEEEKKIFLKFASEPVVLDVVGVTDSFDQAFNSKDWEKVDKNWRDGVVLIYNQLKKALEKNGVETDDPIGQDFNPARHLALEMVKVEKKEDEGKIVDVIQKGYLLNGKVIRPAKVRVGKNEN